MTVENPYRVVKGPDGFDITVVDGPYGPNQVTFDCSVCGLGFFTRAAMEECGKRREDCSMSEKTRQAYAEKVLALYDLYCPDAPPKDTEQ